MKKSIVILFFIVTGAVFAQDKNAKASLEVDGVCFMCKMRIEKAAIKTKGVKSAIWDVETHELRLIYDARKVALEKIQENIAAVGHDTGEFIATDEAYNSVDACCRYRDPKVVQDHEEGGH